MKCLVLLALVGLASCRTVLLGGDNARDVTITYSYTDANGKEIEVEIKADRLDLGLMKAAPAPAALKKAAPAPATPKQAAPAPPTMKRTAPAPTLKKVAPKSAPAPAPVVQTHHFQLVAFPALQPHVFTTNAKPAAPATPAVKPASRVAPQPSVPARKPANPVPAVGKPVASLSPLRAVPATSASDESDED
ncbi:uncharacterized protein [Panulirus ornatus]|uniref:uncharacterized protein n=1 Tax=Panulirus ornatus TaxID=150431 RepID=UPI003A8A3284